MTVNGHLLPTHLAWLCRTKRWVVPNDRSALVAMCGQVALDPDLSFLDPEAMRLELEGWLDAAQRGDAQYLSAYSLGSTKCGIPTPPGFLDVDRAIPIASAIYDEWGIYLDFSGATPSVVVPVGDPVVWKQISSNFDDFARRIGLAS